ncbi:MAG: hypothetical protein Kow0089_21840 [Desulfobulbaceae bacterium]
MRRGRSLYRRGHSNPARGKPGKNSLDRAGAGKEGAMKFYGVQPKDCAGKWLVALQAGKMMAFPQKGVPEKEEVRKTMEVAAGNFHPCP